MKHKLKKRTDAWLQQSFDIYNVRYHYESLPRVKVRYGRLEGSDAHWDPKIREIVVSETLRTHDSLALICLHHEMAHLKMDEEGYMGGTTHKDPFHGPRYQAELVRLYMVGAYDGLL